MGEELLGLIELLTHAWRCSYTKR